MNGPLSNTILVVGDFSDYGDVARGLADHKLLLLRVDNIEKAFELLLPSAMETERRVVGLIVGRGLPASEVRELLHWMDEEVSVPYAIVAGESSVRAAAHVLIPRDEAQEKVLRNLLRLFGG